MDRQQDFSCCCTFPCCTAATSGHSVISSLLHLGRRQQLPSSSAPLLSGELSQAGKRAGRRLEETPASWRAGVGIYSWPHALFGRLNILTYGHEMGWGLAACHPSSIIINHPALSPSSPWRTGLKRHGRADRHGAQAGAYTLPTLWELSGALKHASNLILDRRQ